MISAGLEVRMALEISNPTHFSKVFILQLIIGMNWSLLRNMKAPLSPSDTMSDPGLPDSTDLDLEGQHVIVSAPVRPVPNSVGSALGDIRESDEEEDYGEVISEAEDPFVKFSSLSLIH
jgi:hypothetical protein